MHIHTIPLNIEKLLGGTSHMDATEFGAYMSLIISAYQSGNKLPNDDKRLARMARVTGQKWGKIKRTVMEKFELKDETYEQKYVTNCLAKMKSLSEKNKANALKGNKTPEPVASQPPSQTDANTSIKYQVSSISKKESIEGIFKDAFDLYNQTADRSGLPKAQKLSASRLSKLKARLKDCGGVDGWRVALEKVESSAFLCGSTGWKADLDFILQDKSFTKLMEGSYDGNQSTTKSKSDRAKEALLL